MALQVIIKKRFLKKLQETARYLKEEWNKKVAEEFVILVFYKIQLISKQPDTGKKTSLKNIRSVLIGKGRQNKIYYRIEKNRLIIIDMKDTRMNPKQNRFS